MSRRTSIIDTNPAFLCQTIHPNGTSLPPAVRKLLANGSGGRARFPSAAPGSLNTAYNSPWKLDAPTKNHIQAQDSGTGVGYSGQKVGDDIEKAHEPPPSPKPSSPNIILNYHALKKTVQNNVACKHCVKTSAEKYMEDFFTYCEAHPDISPRMAWLLYIHNQSRLGISRSYADVGVEVEQETHGLATHLILTCCRRNRKFKGHKSVVAAEKRNTNKKNHGQYSLNCASVISSTLNGGSHLDFERASKMLGLPYVAFKTYQKIESDVGEQAEVVAKKSAVEVFSALKNPQLAKRKRERCISGRTVHEKPP